MIKKWEKVILIIRPIMTYYGIESREGKETLKTMFRMLHNCLIFYCLSLDFFVVFYDKLQYWLIMAFYVLQHGWHMQRISGSTFLHVVLIKTTSQVR